jgi:radical SAM protein with 4Fe4S-binding SPASM domain
LTTKECKDALAKSQELGVSVINIVGGEPLMRTDLLEIMQSIDKDLSTVILFTNGYYLAEKAKELKKAGLDGVYISIDSADQKRHDSIRGKKGVYAKAMEGIREAKKVGLTVGISSVVTPESFKNGEFGKIVELAKKQKIHEVLIFDALPVGRFKDRSDLIDSDWIEKMIDDSKVYNADPSYPGVLIYAYATSHRGAGCTGGTGYFYINPYGDINPCDFNGKNFGNILEEPLHQIWEKMTSHPCYSKSTWGGCKVRNSKHAEHDCVGRS